jgi:outer membrane protein TolC
VIHLTLDDAVATALEKNRTILINKREMDKARAGITEAKAHFFPTLSISGGYTRSAAIPEIDFESPIFETRQVAVLDDFGDTIGYTHVDGIVGIRQRTFRMGDENSYVGGFSIQQPIFTWGKIWNGYELARLNLRAVEEDYRKVRNEIVFSVEQAFYRILYLEELLKLTEESYEQVKRHVSVVERRYDAGLASRFDLLRARVQLVNMEPQMLKVRDGLKMAADGLKILLAMALEEEIVLHGELQYTPIDVNLRAAAEQALAQRPELRALRFRKRMAEKALAIAHAANKPSMALAVNYSYQKPHNFRNEWGSSWYATLGLQVPLFSGGVVSARVEQARAQKRQAELSSDMFADVVGLEVRNTVLEMNETAELFRSQEQNVQQAEEALRIAERRYETGLMTNLEVMDTQLALAQAKTNSLQALSNHLVTLCKLKRVIGGKLDGLIDNSE